MKNLFPLVTPITQMVISTHGDCLDVINYLFHIRNRVMFLNIIRRVSSEQANELICIACFQKLQKFTSF